MKRWRWILIATIVACLATEKGLTQVGKSSTGKEIRMPAVAGSFYPSRPDELNKWLDDYFRKAPPPTGNKPLALIVPHAGYLFSGEVAAAGYKQIDRNVTFRHIFLIGPAHKLWFDGATVYTGKAMRTPLGDVPIDPLASELVEKNPFLSANLNAHRDEHSLEVQLPFLQYWLHKPFSVVPILLGGEDKTSASKLAAILAPYMNRENLFIISTDFSHYPRYENAVKSDLTMANAILSNDLSVFMEAKRKNERASVPGLATSVCGWMPMAALLEMTSKKDVTFKKILYRNSGDSSYGDKIKVVGYWAIAASAAPGTANLEAFTISEQDRSALLKLARLTLSEYLQSSLVPVVDKSQLSQTLSAEAGCFVTLRKQGELRGCIGNFSAGKPLYLLVQEMAVAAAVNDSRFQPVTRQELEKISIEISVLTPMKKIESPEEFKLGRDGLYIRKGNRSGTFLPQVADETHWSVEEFFGHCSRDKAGLGWNGWKDPGTELYTYQALIFGEEKPSAGKTNKP